MQSFLQLSSAGLILLIIVAHVDSTPHTLRYFEPQISLQGKATNYPTNSYPIPSCCSVGVGCRKMGDFQCTYMDNHQSTKCC
jgi:hypothetical protein